VAEDLAMCDRQSWSGLQRSIQLVLGIPSANCAKR